MQMITKNSKLETLNVITNQKDVRHLIRGYNIALVCFIVADGFQCQIKTLVLVAGVLLVGMKVNLDIWEDVDRSADISSGTLSSDVALHTIAPFSPPLHHMIVVGIVLW